MIRAPTARRIGCDLYHIAKDLVETGGTACPYSAGVVAQITSGTAFDKHGRPFRRRNFMPGIVVVAALAVVTLMVWVIAFNQPTDVQQAAACNPPPPTADATQTALGEPGHRRDHDGGHPRQARRHQDPRAQRQRPGRAGRRGGRRTARPRLRPARPRPTTPSTRTPGWSARARSGSVRPGAPPPPHCGSSRRAPSSSRISAPTTPSTWRSAPSSPSSATTTTSTPCWRACVPTPPSPPTRRC